MKVAVVGTGYVGLVTGVVLAHLGNDVVCVDKDPAKVEKLRNGIPPIYEPGIEEMLKKTIEDGFFQITDSISDAVETAEVVFIAVGTPPGPDGTPDLTAVRAVAKGIGQSIRKPTVVVNKSTVPVGSGELVEKLIIEAGADPALVNVVSNPEFLREGSAVHDTLNPDRIVIGAKNQAAAQKLVELYSTLNATTVITDLESAELIKYASNSFLALKISFINAVSRICELSGGNVEDVAKGMGLDKRIGSQFLQAGLGWGGSCFPKYVLGTVTVAESLGYDFALLKEVIAINDDQTLNFVRRLDARLGGLAGKRIGIMGLAFKPNTDDIRDAKSLIIIEEILKAGGSVTAHDPIATELVRAIFPTVDYRESIYEVSHGVDALVMVTEWNEYRHLDLQRLAKAMKTPILFDGRRCYKKEVAEAAGFEFHTIGSR